LVTVGYSREQRREDAVHEDGVNPTLTLVRGLPIMETVSVDRSVVDEVNRYQVYFADDEIVSWKPETRPEWFEEREPPPDACENTAEGKKGRANF
jgi:hypothetical protein